MKRDIPFVSNMKTMVLRMLLGLYLGYRILKLPHLREVMEVRLSIGYEAEVLLTRD
jgi:hypothetical protein